MVGMLPPGEPEGTGCQFIVVGRVSSSSDWQLCSASLTEGRPDAVVMAAEGGRVSAAYARDLEGPGTFDVAGSTAYFSLSRLEDVNGTQEYRTWAVAIDFSAPGPARVGFCLQDWRTEGGRNMGTMDFDATRGVVVGMGMNGTGGDASARVMVRLRMAPAAQPPAALPGGAAADHLNSPAASCEWSAEPASYDHPIDIGGLSALINATAHAAAAARRLGGPRAPPSPPPPPPPPQQQLLVWLGSAPMSAITDAVVFDAGTGERVAQVAGVCTDPRGLCYTVMGAG